MNSTKKKKIAAKEAAKEADKYKADKYKQLAWMTPEQAETVLLFKSVDFLSIEDDELKTQYWQLENACNALAAYPQAQAEAFIESMKKYIYE